MVWKETCRAIVISIKLNTCIAHYYLLLKTSGSVNMFNYKKNHYILFFKLVQSMNISTIQQIAILFFFKIPQIYEDICY